MCAPSAILVNADGAFFFVAINTSFSFQIQPAKPSAAVNE